MLKSSAVLKIYAYQLIPKMDRLGGAHKEKYENHINAWLANLAVTLRRKEYSNTKLLATTNLFYVFPWHWDGKYASAAMELCNQPAYDLDSSTLSSIYTLLTKERGSKHVEFTVGSNELEYSRTKTYATVTDALHDIDAQFNRVVRSILSQCKTMLDDLLFTQKYDPDVPQRTLHARARDLLFIAANMPNFLVDTGLVKRLEELYNSTSAS